MQSWWTIVGFDLAQARIRVHELQAAGGFPAAQTVRNQLTPGHGWRFIAGYSSTIEGHRPKIAIRLDDLLRTEPAGVTAPAGSPKSVYTLCGLRLARGESIAGPDAFIEASSGYEALSLGQKKLGSPEQVLVLLALEGRWPIGLAAENLPSWFL